MAVSTANMGLLLAGAAGVLFGAEAGEVGNLPGMWNGEEAVDLNFGGEIRVVEPKVGDVDGF